MDRHDSIRRNACRALLALVLAPALLGAGGPGASSETHSLPDHVVKDPGAPVVTVENLLESERFWPYDVALAEPWPVAPRVEPLPAKTTGVLIRVDATGHARIDFGRDGIQQVPVSATDLLERANRIRLGQDEKAMPNFALALGPRLVDPTSDPLAPYPLPAAIEARGFLCVFADPEAPGFAELAKALASLPSRTGVVTVLFPQGEHPDPAMAKTLLGLGWRVPFVMDHLAEAYTPTLIESGTSLPVVQLQTSEGRVLLEAGWTAGVSEKIREALDASFPGEVRAARRD